MIMVAIIMGSQSDWNVMEQASIMLQALDVPHSIDIVSAHRTPERMFAFAKEAEANGLKVIIAGAGGAAHLPGMVASLTHLPVIGVPIHSRNSIAIDSILSILQMPSGVPVATVALNNAKNAALLAAQMLAISCSDTREKVIRFRLQQSEQIEQDAKAFGRKFPQQQGQNKEI